MQLSLWCNAQRIGLLGEIQTDQPWLQSIIEYDDTLFGEKLERISHFLHVVLEEDWGSFENAEAEDLEFSRRLSAMSLREKDTQCFATEDWELRKDNQREKVRPHYFNNGLFVWRGPTGLL